MAGELKNTTRMAGKVRPQHQNTHGRFAKAVDAPALGKVHIVRRKTDLKRTVPSSMSTSQRMTSPGCIFGMLCTGGS